jgi:hypothetical protein
VAYNNALPGAINIPIAYLTRYCYEIPNGDLIVLASNSLEKNVGVRLLRKNGFCVSGYTICYDKKINVQVIRRLEHGI